MRTRLKIAQRVQYSANIVLAVSTSCRAVHFSGQQDAVILIRSHWTRDVVTGWWVLAQTQAAIFVRYLNFKVFSLKTIDMSIFCFFFFFKFALVTYGECWWCDCQDDKNVMADKHTNRKSSLYWVRSWNDKVIKYGSHAQLWLFSKIKQQNYLKHPRHIQVYSAF